MRIQFKKKKPSDKEYQIIVDGKKVGSSKESSLPLAEIEEMLKQKKTKAKVKLKATK